MKILMIGGTGNISLSVSQQLLNAGHELWLLNRSGASACLPGARFIQADINLHSSLDGNWDVVVNWIAFNPGDIERDLRLFQGRAAQYVFISSASCYQNPGPTPWITERTPLENPYWAYSRAKIAAENRLRQLAAEYDLPFTIVRPSFTYARVIPLAVGGWNEYTAIQRIRDGRPVVVHGDGTSLWTITHADDFARGFCGLLGNPQALGEDFHITSDEFLPWNRIYQLTAAALNCEANIVHVTSDRICALDPDYKGSLLGDKSESALFDNSKIKRVVPEFRCHIPFAEGIKSTLQWFEADADRCYVNPATDTFIDRLVKSALEE